MRPTNRGATSPCEVYINEFARDGFPFLDSFPYVTPEIAAVLASVTATAPEFWLNLQRNYDRAETEPKP